MMLLYLVIGVLLHRASPIFANSKLSCNLYDYYTSNDGESNPDRLFKGVVSLAYERSDLAIYTYDFTQYVNFLLNDVAIIFKGVSTKPNEKDAQELLLSLKTNIEGIAYLKKNKVSPLTKCELDLEKNIKYRKDLPTNLQNKILELVRSCIQPKLCTQLGYLEQDDYIRAKIESHDFSGNSVMYKVLGEKYPNLHLPDSKDSTKVSLQTTLNLFADFWLASAVSQLSGKNLGQIDLPNVNETMDGIPLINKGHFRLYNGTFGNLRSVTRSQDIIITNKGLEFSIVAGFHLPRAKIHFNHFALQYGVLDTEGKIDIDINGIKFNIKVVMNYNESPCKVAITELHSEVGEVTFTLSESSILQGLINDVISKLVNKFTHNLVNFVETKLKEAISGPLGSFDCEKFRP